MKIVDCRMRRILKLIMFNNNAQKKKVGLYECKDKFIHFKDEFKERISHIIEDRG